MTDTVDPDLPVEDPTAPVATARPRRKRAKPSVAELKPDNAVAVADIPSPFRPSHLRAMIAKHKKDNAIPDDDPQLKPFTFRRTMGLPVPLRLFRAQASCGGTHLDVIEIDAVDESEAYRQYILKLPILMEDVHKHRFNAVIVAE